MIQAAHVAPAPSRCHAVCFLPSLRSGPVDSGRAGRTACAARMPRGTRRSANPRRRRRSCASLRSAPSRRRPPRVPRPSAAPGRVPGSPQPPPNHGSRCAWCRGGGSAIPLPLVALRLRSLRSLRPGPHGRALARDRAARLRLLSRPKRGSVRYPLVFSCLRPQFEVSPRSGSPAGAG